MTTRSSSGMTLKAMLVLFSALFATASIFAQQGLKFDSATISGLPARNIGSAAMSGRIAAVDGVDENGQVTFFVGAASGGR